LRQLQAIIIDRVLGVDRSVLRAFLMAIIG